MNKINISVNGRTKIKKATDISLKLHR